MGVIGVSLAVNAKTSNRVVDFFDCDASAAVGDLVYQDTTVDQSVIVASNNTTTEPIIGIVFDKSDSTRCRVLFIGVMVGYSGLTRGGKIFLSTLGGVTTTKPATGYMHILGVAVSATEILFLPNNVRILQNV